MYTPGPTEEEAATFGLTVEEASGPPVEVWEELATSINVFVAMSTQWRVGPAGATGLDYGALPAVMELLGVPHCARRDVFNDVRVMEDEALATMRKK